MSASTVLSVIAPVVGAASSPSATAGEDVSAEFAAMISDTDEGEAAAPSAGATLSTAPAAPVTAPPPQTHAAPKADTPKAAPAVITIDMAAEMTIETAPATDDADPETSDGASEAPVKVKASDAEEATPKIDAESADTGLVPPASSPAPAPAPRAALAPAASPSVLPAPGAANDAASVPVAPVDEAAPARDVSEPAPVQTEADAASPVAAAVSPARIVPAEPVKPEPVRLAAAARGKTADVSVDMAAPSPDTPKAAGSPTTAPPTAPPAPSAAPQPAVASAPADAGALPPPEAAAAPALEEAPPPSARAESPAPAHAQVAASSLSRATVETTVQIAAQIVRKLESRQTRFDMVLTPEDLGRVDVSLDIDSDGRLAARLAFDNPAAAADLRGRADELRRQLADAGFQLSQDAFEFTERDANAFSGGGFDRGHDRAFSFAGGKRLGDQADQAAAARPAAWINLSLTPDRVDMRV